MEKRKISYIVNADGSLNITIPQYAGVAGEHHATKLVFMSSRATSYFEGEPLIRLRFTLGDGAVVSSDLLTLMTDTAAGYASVTYELPQLITAAGGQVAARLVLSHIVEGEERFTALSEEAVLYFDDAVTESGTPFWTGVSQMLQNTASARKEASEAKDAAQSQAAVATAQAQTAQTAAGTAVKAKQDAAAYAENAAEDAGVAAEALEQILSETVMRYKGEATTEELVRRMLDGTLIKGDVYYVPQAAWHYLWTGTAWSVFGGGAFSGGPSAYDVAVAHGFRGSEEAWLASLKGEPGVDGTTQLVPLFANTTEECTDREKVYVLADGNIYAYMTKTVTHTPFNQLTNTVDTDGTPYNGGVGYKNACTIHMNTGADYAAHERQWVSGYIPCAYGDVIRTKDIDFTNTDAYWRIGFYDASFTYIEGFSSNFQYAPIDAYIDENGNLVLDTANTGTKRVTEAQMKAMAYFRISSMDILSSSLVTLNESTEATSHVETGWLNTGHAFVPADCEARLLELEREVSTMKKPPVSRHEGRVCVCFGDSIVGNMPSPYDYPTVLGQETGMTVYNVGFGGCRMSASMDNVYDVYSMVKLADAVTTGDFTAQEQGLAQANIAYFEDHLTTLKAIDWSKVDFVTIGYGTNDIANFVAVDNESDPLDTTTVKGALRYVLTKLLTAYPHLRVLVLTPIYRYFDNEGVDSNEKEWYLGRTFTTWTDGILDVAREFGVPAVDMYRTLGFNKLTRVQYFPSDDGTHPNALGLRRIACKIAGKLQSEY